MRLGFRTIGIVGMGLIGGSLAKCIKAAGDSTIYCCDKEKTVVDRAIHEGCADGVLNENTLPKCDLLIVALFPKDIPIYVGSVVNQLNKACVVMDICGVKTQVCAQLEEICAQRKITFIGCHPMAGKEVRGFQNSTSHLFHNASMIIAEDRENTAAQRLAKFFLRIGFKRVVFTTGEEHDKIMAYTSQLAHVVSSAYVKSPTAKKYSGFSAGSFKDLSRVAKLNPEMWTQLFLANKEHLVYEIDSIMEKLQQYKDAIECGDETGLFALLKEGSDIKEALEREEAGN